MLVLLTWQPDWRHFSGALHPQLNCCRTTARCLDGRLGTEPALFSGDGCLQVGTGAFGATQSIILGVCTARNFHFRHHFRTTYLEQSFIDCCMSRSAPFHRMWLWWSWGWLIQVSASKSTVCLWAHNPLQQWKRLANAADAQHLKKYGQDK